MDRREEQKETPLKKKRESEHVTNTDEYIDYFKLYSPF